MTKPRKTRKSNGPKIIEASVGPSAVFAQRNDLLVTTGMIEVPPGIAGGSASRVYFEDTGGDGPALVFIYGLGCSIHHWKHQLNYLARTNHRIVWLDYRGHGRSPALESGTRLRMDMLEDDIAAVCTALGIEAATLLGQSMGGTLALQFAFNHSKLVKGLVLLAAPPRPPSQTFQLGKIGAAAWQAAIEINKRSPATVRMGMAGMRRLIRPMREVVRVLGFNPQLADTNDIEEYVEELLDADPNHFWDLAADLEGLELDKITLEIKCPTLVVAGARDQVVPLDHSVWLAKRLAGAELEIVQHGSHCPHFDDPPLVNRRIERFLRTHGL